MKPGEYLLIIALFGVIASPRARASSLDDDPQTDHQLSLADMAGYRAALSGKPSAENVRASDPPIQVSFKELWNRPEFFRGRRVTVGGQVTRSFRQGPVGSFPALAEVWITSSVGDPYCIVFPLPLSTDRNPSETGAPKATGGDFSESIATTEPGKKVRFTGTFLKIVRYAGGDGPRLAPLIVGDRVPEPVAKTSDSSRGAGIDLAGGKSFSPRMALGPAYWAIALAVLAACAVVVARWHLRTPARPAAGRRASTSEVADPRLEFIEPRDER
jgi:hypothetical protein